MTVTMIRTGIAAAIGIALAAPAAAQDILQYRAEAAAGEPQAGLSVVALDPISMGPAVLNAPYSAEAITEVTHTLSDGNRIERRTTATIARGTDGRTRREQRGFALGGFVAENEAPIVTITDPTSGVHLTLNYDQKIAFRSKPMWIAAADGPVAGAEVRFSTAPFGSRKDGIKIGRRSAGAAGVDVPPPPPSPGQPFDEPVLAIDGPGAPREMPWNAAYKSEQLEATTIEGLRAEGLRTTLTIPAGAVGNTLPIEVVSERWFSPELQIVLLTRRFDPRFGETVYRVTNVTREEPAAELFKVPSGFRIQDIKP
jgi:hypothetical protein